MTAATATGDPTAIGLTLGTIGVCTVILTATRFAPDVVLVSGLAFLLVCGVVSPREGLGGFSEEALFTVAALYVVAEGVRQTGAMARLAGPLLGSPSSPAGAAVRLLTPAAAMSAFLNNTPVVAMLIPTVIDWARRLRLSASHLLLPLSYATMLGGLCTILGTSTTILVNGMLGDETFASEFGTRSLGFFEIAWVGLPCCLVGLTFLMVASRRLLKDRRPPIDPVDDARNYTVEMIVDPNGPVAGRTIGQAGLRNLPGVFLAEIERDGNVVSNVSRQTPLAAGDRLVFVGAVGSVVDLKKMPGLSPATEELGKLNSSRLFRGLVEAVVSARSPLVGQTIREAQFRTRYNAVVIAVAREGERIPGKIGDIRVKPGDTLLLETQPDFTTLHRGSRDFLLVSKVDDSAPVRHERAWLALLVLGAMIAGAILIDAYDTRDDGPSSMFIASLVAAAAMILLRCCTVVEAKRSVDPSVLVTMAAGIGLGHAMDATGAAELVASRSLAVSGGQAWASLAVVGLLTMIASNLITAKAAAVIILPIALRTAQQTGVDPMPFAVAIIVAAASSFATPFGYQTNLMVYGPGGYKANDFLRLGVPLSLVVWIVATGLIPLVWPF